MTSFTDMVNNTMNAPFLERVISRRISAKERKLSKKGFLILHSFGNNEKLYGLQILERTGIFSGTLYPLLRKLETNGWLDYEYEQGDERTLGRPIRIYYWLTPIGNTKLVEKKRQFEAQRKQLDKRAKRLKELLA